MVDGAVQRSVDARHPQNPQIENDAVRYALG
jgi:hypothetical protein